jgi:hypothetical protein
VAVLQLSFVQVKEILQVEDLSEIGYLFFLFLLCCGRYSLSFSQVKEILQEEEDLSEIVCFNCF